MSAHETTRVESVMSTPIETISKSASVREAAERMQEGGINSLLVPGAETGIVTSTDVVAAVADGEDPEQCRVEDVMTVPIEWVEVDLGLGEVAAMMDTHGVNHFPVRDRDGDYVGIVSSTDLREAIATR